MQCWSLQNAKAQLSELIKVTRRQGPQSISVRGKEEVVVIPKEMYDSFTGTNISFLEFMNQSPLKNLDLDLERDQSVGRELEL